MSAKYQEYFDRMVEINKTAFDDFKKLHNNYALNPERLQEKFNIEGEKILAIIHEWENKLCSQSEKAGFGNYTTSLAEKFQGEVRKRFPEIVNVGLVTSSSVANPPFTLKKINLH